jgi:hypothetical protein
MTTEQQALAAEIRAEAAAQRITAKDMQRATGVSSSAWSNYFVACVRDVPIGVVIAVAEALGMTGSELLHRAEARAGQSPSTDPVDAELEAGLSPAARRAVERARAEAGENSVDPSGRARVDVDDGVMVA